MGNKSVERRDRWKTRGRRSEISLVFRNEAEILY
jgi:hypothetical protein